MLFYSSNSGVTYIVTVLRGLLRTHPFIAFLNARLKGPKILISNGYKQCDVCGGIVRRVIPLSLAKLIASNKGCDLWLFRKSMMWWSLEQRVYFLMCSR